MTTSIQLKVYFSDIFNVSPNKIKNYGAFNISLINDLPLFIDPFLIFNSKKPEYQDLHNEVLNYVLFLKNKSKINLNNGLIKSWYHFPEIKQNWLGFSKSGNSGRGLGAKFANQIKNELTTVFSDFGTEAEIGSHLGKLTLIKGGIGKDNISDFTCNLIKGYIAKYTEEFALKNINKSKIKEINLDKIRFNFDTETWSSEKFYLPFFNGDYVLLTPTDILTKDDAWISHNNFIEDFSSIVSAVDNDQLRSQIDNYFKKQLPLIQPSKKDYEKAVEKTIKAYPELINLYIKIRESKGYEAEADNIEKINSSNEIFVEKLKDLISKLAETKFYEIKTNSFDESIERINHLKHVIEKQDGYRLFYVDKKPIQRESDLQIMFKLTWFASAYSFDAEVNNGRGPADFVVSYGSSDKTVIEFKLAKSSQLEKNLNNQAEIYSDASRATNAPIKVILYFKDEELTKVNRLLDKYKLRDKKEIILIDARVKDSASKTGE